MAIKQSNNGETLTQADKQALRDAVRCEVVIKDEATQERYEQLVKRWNESFIQPAVSALPLFPPLPPHHQNALLMMTTT